MSNEIGSMNTVVRPQETKAVSMCEHGARHDVEMACQAVFVGAVSQQLTVTHHGAHASLERAAVLLRVNAETRRERFEPQRLASLLHGGEDFVAARNFVLVAPLVGA